MKFNKQLQWGGGWMATAALGAALLGGGAVATVALADPASVRTTQDVYWNWEWNQPGKAVGTSQLVRNESGVTATLTTTGLPKGHAMTLWIITFNSPDKCWDKPCSILDLMVNPEAEGDFHFGGGAVTGQGKTTLAGHLSVGDITGSGKAELAALGVPVPPPVPLTNPYGAEVRLAVHSHGPKLEGQDLKAQISSFTGGCFVQPFLGDMFGWAEDADDVPANPGECSTIQYAVH